MTKNFLIFYIHMVICDDRLEEILKAVSLNFITPCNFSN